MLKRALLATTMLTVAACGEAIDDSATDDLANAEVNYTIVNEEEPKAGPRRGIKIEIEAQKGWSREEKIHVMKVAAVKRHRQDRPHAVAVRLWYGYENERPTFVGRIIYAPDGCSWYDPAWYDRNCTNPIWTELKISDRAEIKKRREQVRTLDKSKGHTPEACGTFPNLSYIPEEYYCPSPYVEMVSTGPGDWDYDRAWSCPDSGYMIGHYDYKKGCSGQKTNPESGISFFDNFVPAGTKIPTNYRAEFDKYVLDPCLREIAARKSSGELGPEFMFSVLKQDRVTKSGGDRLYQDSLPFVQDKPEEYRKQVYAFGLKSCLKGVK